MSIPTPIAALYNQNRKEIRRFVKFAIVGVSGSVVDFTLLNLAHKTFPWPQMTDGSLTFTVGWPLVAANTLSFSLAVVNNFTWNRLWTFPESRSRRKRQQLPQFVLVNVVGLVINNSFLLGMQSLLSQYIRDPWDYNLTKAVAIGVVLFWNFGVNSMWTYRGL